MYRKLCSLAVLVLLCGIASAAPVWVFDSSDPNHFISPWVSGSAAIEFQLDDVNEVAFGSTTGQGYVSFVTSPADANVAITGNRYLDMDIRFDSSQPGDGLIAIVMDVDGVPWAWKWTSTSQVSVDGGPFQAIYNGVMQNLSQDEWHNLKLRLETGAPESAWGTRGNTWPADPCAGQIHLHVVDAGLVQARDVFFNDTPTGAAYDMTPADGTPDVDVDVTLQWQAGAGAISHKVYIGTDLTAVQNGTATSYTPGTTSQSLSLDLGKRYYWKVVENDGSNDYVSNIQSFDTIKCIVVEDFEAYGTSLPTYWTGLEQYTNVALATNVTRDAKSLFLEGYSHMSPYVVTAQRQYTTAQDLTVHGIRAISFWVAGMTTNPAEPIFCKLQDSSGNRGRYVFTNTSYSQSAVFNQLNVPLNGLVIDGTASLPNLHNITKMQFGLGDGVSGGGNYAVLYIDDIELQPQRCVSSLVVGDFTNDCTVDGYDLKRMAYHWLYDPTDVPQVYAEAPANPPLAYYSFDQGSGPTCENEQNSGVYDASMFLMDGAGGNQASDPAFPVNVAGGDPNVYWDRWEENARRDRDANGVLTDPNQAIPTHDDYVWDPPAYDGNCVDCEPSNGAAYAKVPASLFTHIDKQITITAWVAADPCNLPQTGASYFMLFQGENGDGTCQPGQHMLMSILGLPNVDSDPNAIEWRAGNGVQGGDEQGVPGQGTNQLLWERAYTDYPGELTTVPWNSNDPNERMAAWKHFAFVKDASSGFMRIYCNGIPRASTNVKFQSMAGVVEFIIGGSVDNWTGHCFRGKIDEFRIYDYALSQAEVMYLAGRDGPDDPADTGPSIANIKDSAGDQWPGIVNFLDFATLAPNWQKQNVLFPQ